MEHTTSQSTSGSIPGKRTRHSGKSRSGCKTCKTRKIKCDEGQPECAKCVSFGVPCDFLPSEEQSIRISASSPGQESGPTRNRARRRGRPRKDWIQWTTNRLPTRELGPVDDVQRHASAERGDAHGLSQSATFCTGNIPSSPSATHSTTSRPSLNAEDLFILHHYMTVTAPTIGHPHIWREGVPTLGQDFPGIFHSLLAVTAYHMAKTQALRAPELRIIAERHYASAVQETTSMMANLSIENAQASYASATLICFTAFAKGPSPGDLVLVGGQGVVPWVRLLRGVRLILQTFGPAIILSGILDPNAEPTSWPNSCTCPPKDDRPGGRRFELSYEGWDWCASLNLLDETVASSMLPEKAAIFRPQIAGLVQCYQSLVQDRQGKNSFEANGDELISVMSWVYRLEDPFTDALLRRDPISLVVLGFFGILLRSLKGFWWLEGWGEHIVAEVQQLLGASYDEWLPRWHGFGTT